ncbi:MAG TPA: hypothetical protein VG309_09380 [Rhizomicrobium sp.]|jgi:hypothetical protein|nr:hypothetical protein [Rhizomicrobium sp.]
MTLRKTIEVVTKLAERRVIGSYAIAGAVAALNYIEPMLTEDLDILISIDGFEKRSSGLLLLAPIEKALADMGYTERTNVGYNVEDWPVQFLPVSSALDEEALADAIDLDISQSGETPLKARCLRAEHVVAIALKVGRLKDLARIQAFLEQDAVELALLKAVLEKHNLTGTWKEFCIKAVIKNPLADTK